MTQLPLAFAILLACLAPATARSPFEDVTITPELATAHAQALALRPDQRTALDRLTADIPARIAPLIQQMQDEAGALRKLLQGDKPDEATVLAQFERLNAIETELKRLRLQLGIRTKAILTPDQFRRASGLKGGTGPSPEARPNSLPDKLRKLKAGLERWKAEGRDTTELQALWDRFQEAEARGFYGEARRTLDAAIALVEGSSPTPTPAR